MNKQWLVTECKKWGKAILQGLMIIAITVSLSMFAGIGFTIGADKAGGLLKLNVTYHEAKQ